MYDDDTNAGIFYNLLCKYVYLKYEYLRYPKEKLPKMLTPLVLGVNFFNWLKTSEEAGKNEFIKDILYSPELLMYFLKHYGFVRYQDIDTKQLVICVEKYHLLTNQLELANERRRLTFNKVNDLISLVIEEEIKTKRHLLSDNIIRTNMVRSLCWIHSLDSDEGFKHEVHKATGKGVLVYWVKHFFNNPKFKLKFKHYTGKPLRLLADVFEIEILPNERRSEEKDC